MSTIRRIATLLCLLPLTVWSAPSLPPGSFSLAAIVNGRQTPPFACSVGDYRVTLLSHGTEGITARVTGKGILLNAQSLTNSVGSNPDIRYVFPAQAAIAEGTRLSAFCTSGGKPGEAPITYFLSQR